MEKDAASTSSSAHWEHFAHGADLGVRGFGPTPEAAYEQAYLAISSAIVDPASVRL
ncbi:archease [Methylocystis hirsuta]|uniref:archease n=1 Tax=Methylocystis hirsuta TaxID=369798 RepID=UPI0011CD5FDD|nr:archease [Methylocystis hirsuta]